MAKHRIQNDDDDAVDLSPVPMTAEEISAAVAAGVREVVAQMAPRKVPFGKYWPRNSFHPTREEAKYFTRGRTYYQNGFPLSWDTTFDSEIVLLNRLTQTGRYLEREPGSGDYLVRVYVVKKGAGEEDVHINYHNRSVDQRFENARFFTSFQNLLERILSEQDAPKEAPSLV